MSTESDFIAMLFELVCAWVAISGIPFFLSTIPFWLCIFIIVVFIFPYVAIMFYAVDSIFGMIYRRKVKILSCISLVALAYYKIDEICHYEMWNDYKFDVQGILIVTLIIVLAVLFFGRCFYVKLKKN